MQHSDDHSAAPPKQAEGFVAVTVLALAVLLIAISPFVTRAQPSDKAWFLAPIIGPLFALAIMAIPAAVLSWSWWKNYNVAESRADYMQKSKWAFGDFRAAFEYGIYFCIYLWSISYLGFAISTLLFGQLCLYRSGLRSRNWIWANLAFSFVLLLLLRVFLGLWFPMAPIFKLLPPGIGNFLGTYF